MKSKFVVIFLGSAAILMLARHWQIRDFHAAAFYLIGNLVMVLILRLSRTPTNGKVGEALDAMTSDIETEMARKPVSPNDIVEFLKECTDHCRKYNI